MHGPRAVVLGHHESRHRARVAYGPYRFGGRAPPRRVDLDRAPLVGRRPPPGLPHARRSAALQRRAAGRVPRLATPARRLSATSATAARSRAREGRRRDRRRGERRRADRAGGRRAAAGHPHGAHAGVGWLGLDRVERAPGCALAADRAPRRRHAPPGVAGRFVPFDADVGTDRRGRAVATFSRCESDPQPGPAGGRAWWLADGCRLRVVDLAGRSVLAASGARWAPRTRRRRCAAGRIAFAAARRPRPGAAPRVVLYDATTGVCAHCPAAAPAPSRAWTWARGSSPSSGTRPRAPAAGRSWPATLPGTPRDRLRVHRRGVHGQPRLLQALDARGRGCAPSRS